MHHAEKNKNVIYRLGRSVLKNMLQNIFPVRTSHPVNNIYIFFKIQYDEKKYKIIYFNRRTTGNFLF